jgi:enoyl-CoA hydratase/carnithine racemase
VELTDIRFTKENGVAVAIFDRPECLNAFRPGTYHELLRVLDDAEHDESVRAVVLSGAGRAFCAGDDLRELSNRLENGTSLVEHVNWIESLQEVTRRIVGLPKPVIAAVNGPAVGFGAELAVACDIRIAAEDASFAFPEAKRSLFVTNGLLGLLPQLIGFGRAMELMLTGAAVDARAAERIGLVTHVVPNGYAREAAEALARAIAGNAPISVRLVKQLGRRAQEMDLESVLRLEVEGVSECLASSDLAEGTRAFVERRAPQWSGR